MLQRFACIGVMALTFAALGAVLIGCEPQEQQQRPSRPDPNAPEPPTPEEIAGKIISDAQLRTMARRGASLPPSVRANILGVIRQANVQHSATQEGKMVLSIVKRKVEQAVRDYEQAELWEHTITYIEAHQILDPNSTKFNRVREKAEIELRKPRITVRGLTEFDGRKVALLSFYLPTTSKTVSERMAIGEEMHGIRFLGIFGEDRGVRLEYLETGERFVAYLAAAK